MLNVLLLVPLMGTHCWEMLHFWRSAFSSGSCRNSTINYQEFISETLKFWGYKWRHKCPSGKHIHYLAMYKINPPKDLNVFADLYLADARLLYTVENTNWLLTEKKKCQFLKQFKISQSQWKCWRIVQIAHRLLVSYTHTYIILYVCT